MKKMEELVGLHILSGFDDSIPDKIGIYNEFNRLEDGICFILDNKSYQVYTNCDDGYRSYSSEIFEDDIKCSNTFPNELIFIVYNENNFIQELIFYNMKSEKIAEFGTNSTDSYYPYAYSRFYPENLAVNKIEGDVK